MGDIMAIDFLNLNLVQGIYLGNKVELLVVLFND